MLVTELNAGQMIEDVRLAVNGKVTVSYTHLVDSRFATVEETVDAPAYSVQ